jgi:Putative prokaryotic signal transducing protein
MEEVFRTNDPVKLSYIEHLLAEADVEFVVLDRHISAIEGNIGIFPRRVLVNEGQLARARLALSGVEPG